MWTRLHTRSEYGAEKTLVLAHPLYVCEPPGPEEDIYELGTASV